MPTLILSNRYTSDSQALWRAAIHKGWDVQRLSGWRVPENAPVVSEPVIYTEALAGQILAEQFNVALLEPAIDWLPSLPMEYRKRWVRLSSLGEARRLKEPAFVKPPNDKSFPAEVYTGSELPADFPDDMPVLVAEIVVWEKEFRCFVLDRSLYTYSLYLRDGELQDEHGYESSEGEEGELRAFLAELLADLRVNLLNAAVLDVGFIDSRGWAVVEQNAAWGSGIYGCDPDRVLDVLQAATVLASDLPKLDPANSRS